MTEPTPRRERIRKPGPLPVIAGSLGLFLAVTALLAFQLRAGADPALGAGEPQLVAAASVPRKVVIRRREIVTRIIEHRGGVAPPPSRAAATPPATGPGRSAPSSAAAAPAPAGAAPSAPAPAPLTTRSS
jgi:hypothetical protein